MAKDFGKLGRIRPSTMIGVRIMRDTNPRRFYALLAASVFSGLIPTAFTVAGGAVIAQTPKAVRSGSFSTPEGKSLFLAIAILMLTFLLRDVVSSFSSAYINGYRAEVNASRRRRVMMAALSVRGIRHLEDTEFVDAMRLASTRDWPDPGSFAAGVYNLVTARITAVTSAIIVATYRPVLAVALLVLWTVIGYFMRIGQAEGFDAGREDLRRSDYFRSVAFDNVASKEIRIFGLNNWVLDHFTSAWREVMDRVWAQRRKRMSQRVLLLVVVLIGACGSFAILGYDVSQGRVSLAQLAVVAPAMLGITTVALMTDATMSVSLGAIAFPAVIEVEERAKSDPRLVMNGTEPAAGHPTHSVVFENVHFTYPGREYPVFDGLNLTIEAGKSLGIVGNNGAGKTTLIKLLARLYDPDEGRILVDGVDLRSLDAPDWQRRVAAIFQDFVHWPYSASDNVSFGGIDFLGNRARLDSAAERVGVSTLIEKLPSGWDTVLSRRYEGGADISGGQWQRLALARALFAVEAGAGVLVLDEPTANLDARAEVELFDRFIEVTEGSTAVLISHRFSTVRRANRIVVIEKGKVTEDGTHDGLLALNGAYAGAFRLQADRYGEPTTGIEAEDGHSHARDTNIDDVDAEVAE